MGRGFCKLRVQQDAPGCASGRIAPVFCRVIQRRSLLISEASIYMPKITFIEHSGKSHQVEAGVGDNLMQIALNHRISGILGDCGGNCACATCHVYVDAPWNAKVPPPEAMEKEMIECTLHPQATSRLGCQ